MARLSHMPQQAIISALASCIDFYEWRGIPCARKMPTWPKRRPTPAEEANQQAFAYIMHLSKELPPFVVEVWRQMAQGTAFRWQDLLVRGYISGFTY